MEYYESKYTGAEVDALLDKVNSGEVGGKVTVDSALSTESENPVQNKVITEELAKNPFEKGESANSAVLKGVEYNNIKTTAIGNASCAMGAGTKSIADATHTEGALTIAGRKQEDLLSAATELGIGGTIEEIAMKLLGFAAHAEGIGTQALGTSSHSEGSATQALANSTHSEGDSTVAFGEASHAEGYQTRAEGNQSHAEGLNTQALGNSSHAEGQGTITRNRGEHASGRFNVSTEYTGDNEQSSTQFSIGIGISDTNRKNAFEVKRNGDCFIIGIGDFTGNNYDSSKSVQQVITELVNKLNEITTND